MILRAVHYLCVVGRGINRVHKPCSVRTDNNDRVGEIVSAHFAAQNIAKRNALKCPRSARIWQIPVPACVCRRGLRRVQAVCLGIFARKQIGKGGKTFPVRQVYFKNLMPQKAVGVIHGVDVSNLGGAFKPVKGIVNAFNEIVGHVAAAVLCFHKCGGEVDRARCHDVAALLGCLRQIAVDFGVGFARKKHVDAYCGGAGGGVRAVERLYNVCKYGSVPCVKGT